MVTFLSKTAIYALRAMAYLSKVYQDPSPVSGKQLSESTHIPLHYLLKIMRRLVQHQLINSQKGHGGGFRLAHEPKEIRFLDILTAMDQTLTASQCVFEWRECNPFQPCPLHQPWSQLEQMVYTWADSTTLESLVS